MDYVVYVHYRDMGVIKTMDDCYGGISACVSHVALQLQQKTDQTIRGYSICKRKNNRVTRVLTHKLPLK